MKFFLDNNLSPKLAKCLHVLTQPDHEVIHLKERFASNTPDEVWMRVKCFPDLLETASKARTGSMYFVTMHGKIES